MLNPGATPSLISSSTPSSITSSPNHPTRTPNYSSNHTPNHPQSHIATSHSSPVNHNPDGVTNPSSGKLNHSVGQLYHSAGQVNHSISGQINQLTRQANHSIAGHSITVQIHHQIAGPPNHSTEQLHHPTNSTKLQINHSTELLNQKNINHSSRQLNDSTDLLNQHLNHTTDILNQHLHHPAELINYSRDKVNHSRAQIHHFPIAQHNHSAVAHLNHTNAHLNHSNSPLNHSNNYINHSSEHQNHAIVAHTSSSSTPRHYPHQVLYPLPKLTSTNSSISSNSNSTISFSSSNVSYRTLDPHSDATDSSPRSVIRHIHSSAAPSPDCRSHSGSGCPPDQTMATNSANSLSPNLNSPSPKPWSPAESIMKHHHHHHVQELQYPRSPSILSDKKANNCVDSDARRSSSSSSRKGLSSIDSWKHRDLGSSSRSSFSDQSVSQGSEVQAKKNDNAINNHQPKKYNSDHIQKPRSAAANYLIQNASMQKGMQFRSLNYPPKAMSDVVSVDDDRCSVASRQSRAPRSPEATLLGQHHHHQHHQRIMNCSKWEDAEKWLSQGAGCRGFANNPLRMLGGGRSSAWSSNNGSLQGSPANHSHHVQAGKPFQTPTQAVSIDCFNATKPASNKYTPLDQQQHQQFQHPSPQTINNPKSHDQFLQVRSPNVHHNGESKSQNTTNTLALKPQMQTPHVHHNMESNIDNLQLATKETSISFDQRKVNAWIPPPSSDIQAQRTLRPDPTDRLTNKESCTLGNIGISNAMNRAYPIKEAVVISTTLREVGTQITSIDGSNSTSRYPSKNGSPQKEISPARHNTPARLRLMHRQPNLGTGAKGYLGNQLLDLNELAHCHRAKLELEALSEGDRIHSFQRSTSNWSSREAEEADLSRSLRHSMDLHDHNQAPQQVVQAMGSPRNITKLAKLKRKEAQIQAWEAQKKEKANAELKKLEEKLEKQRSQMTNKIMNKLLAAQKQAEDKRAIIRFEQSKTSLEARRARHRSLSPTPRCACFT